MAFIGNTNTTQAFTPAVDFFSGNASTTAFTLSRPVASVAQVQAVISNVPQDPGSAYTVSSNTITFTSAPLSGTNNIYVYYTSPITQVIAPGQGTVTATSMVSSTGTGAGVFQTSPTITTPTISSLSSASATALTLQSAGTTAITVDTSQNVGIGTSSPSNKLDVFRSTFGGSNTSFILSSVNSVSAKINFAGIGYSVDQGSAGIEAGSMYFSTYGSGALTERMRIDSSGNVLIGKTTSIAGGRVTIKSATTQHLGEWQVGTDGYGNLMYNAAGTNVGAINIASASTSYVTTSDYRLKEDVIPMIGALAKVAQLKPVTYKWKADGSNSQGFIAHELQEIVSECVVGEKDAVNEDGSIKPQGIDTSFLVATLTAAIQEQQALITALTARITALENT